MSDEASVQKVDPHAIPERFRKQVDDYLAAVKDLGPDYHGTCEHFHPGYSCAAFTLKRIPDGLPSALKVYVPIHFLPMLIFRRKAFFKEYEALCFCSVLHAISAHFPSDDFIARRTTCCTPL
jgi:hypothetical protein